MSNRDCQILVTIRHPVGGIRSFVRYVYPNFAAARYTFTLVAPATPHIDALLDDLKGLDVRYVDVAVRHAGTALTKAVARLMRSARFDLVHSHGFTSAASAVATAALTRTPHIVTCHDAIPEGQLTGIVGGAKRIALGCVLSLADRVHCVSHDARHNLLDRIPMLRAFPDKVVAIPNGIDVRPFQRAVRRDLKRELGLPANAFVVGFLGRFMSPKGFRYLVDAIEILRTKPLPRPLFVLTFSEQDGYYREEIADVRRRGLDGLIRFLPFLPDVSSTLKGLDVLATPSVWEACGLLPMEAMVAGVPVIGTDCVGLREVLRDTPAAVVPSRNGNALADALLGELEHPSTDRASRFAAEAAARFDVRSRAADLERLALDLVDRRSRKRSHRTRAAAKLPEGASHRDAGPT